MVACEPYRGTTLRGGWTGCGARQWERRLVGLVHQPAIELGHQPGARAVHGNRCIAGGAPKRHRRFHGPGTARPLQPVPPERPGAGA